MQSVERIPLSGGWGLVSEVWAGLESELMAAGQALHEGCLPGPAVAVKSSLCLMLISLYVGFLSQETCGL